METFRARGIYPMAHAAEVARVCGPGSHVVALGCYDEHVRVYDLAAQRLVAQIRLPSNVYRVAFIPDSPLLLVRAKRSLTREYHYYTNEECAINFRR